MNEVWHKPHGVAVHSVNTAMGAVLEGVDHNDAETQLRKYYNPPHSPRLVIVSSYRS